MTEQERAAATLATYCQDCGALPGEKCSTKNGRPHQRRKATARIADPDRLKRVLTDPRAFAQTTGITG